jgi:hypothetical protein
MAEEMTIQKATKQQRLVSVTRACLQRVKGPGLRDGVNRDP